MKRIVAAALIGTAIALAAPAAFAAPATDKAASVFAGADVIEVGHSSGDRRRIIAGIIAVTAIAAMAGNTTIATGVITGTGAETMPRLVSWAGSHWA